MNWKNLKKTQIKGGERMAFKKAQKVTLSDLDTATKEYEALLKKTEKTYRKWDDEKDASFKSITEVEDLAASISHNQFSINRKLKKLTINREKYKSRETIERQKRKDDIVAGTGALAVLGAGAAAAVSFWDYVVEFVSKKTGGKLGKNFVVWLIVIGIILVVGIFLLIGWCLNRWKASLEAAKNTKKLLNLTAELRKKEADATTLTAEMEQQRRIVDQYIEALSQYRGMRFKDIPKDGQNHLVMMVDEAILLSEIISKEEIK